MALPGSWFSTGYYGHSRAKSRADLCNYYRQLAQPIPPRKFSDRQKTEVTFHPFSQHDNRSKFEGDPLFRASESGFGRRRSEMNKRGHFDPLFLGWTPKVIEKEKVSDVSSSILQSMPTIESSTYVSAYSHGQPDRERAQQTHRETFQRFASTRTRRLLLERDEKENNVASCLVWNCEKKKNNETLSVEIIPFKTSSNRSKPLQSESLPNFKSPPISRSTTTLDNLLSKYL